MAHGVSDRQVQSVVVEAVVVSVSGDVGGGDQGAGQGELGRLAGGGGGKELAVDFCREADGGGAVAPVVEIGETAVGDDDVGQRVRGVLDLFQDVPCDVGEEQFQNADRVPAVGDGCQNPMPFRAFGNPHHLLASQYLVVDPAVGERDPLGTVFLRHALRVAHPQHAASHHVHEQERHVPCAEPIAEIARHDIEGVHRRGILRSRQHPSQTEPITHHENLQCQRVLLPAPRQNVPRARYPAITSQEPGQNERQLRARTDRAILRLGWPEGRVGCPEPAW